MSESFTRCRLELVSMPPEILHLIADFYVLDPDAVATITSVLTACSLFRDLFLPKLYSSVTIYSIDQLARFVSPTSGAHHYCPIYTTQSITINIPGVPGGGDGQLPMTSERMERSRNRLALAAAALALCPNVQEVSLEFFSVRHSEILTTDEFRAAEADAFESAIKRLAKVTKFRWTPPRCDAKAIMGLSIVIVDQVIAPLSRGLVGCTSLETLELWNTMLPTESGGRDLAASLIALQRPIELNLRSVTGLNPSAVSDLALATPPVRVNIADGFVGSIWGARIDQTTVQDSMWHKLDSEHSSRGGSPVSSQATSIATSRAATPELLFDEVIAKASENVTIRVLQGGIAGSRILAH